MTAATVFIAIRRVDGSECIDIKTAAYKREAAENIARADEAQMGKPWADAYPTVRIGKFCLKEVTE